MRTDEKNLVVPRRCAPPSRSLGGQPRGLGGRLRQPHPARSGAGVVGGGDRLRAHGGPVVDRRRGRTPARRGLLALATSIEGHPDNVAAALGGQLCLAWTGSVGHGPLVVAPGPARDRSRSCSCRRPRSPTVQGSPAAAGRGPARGRRSQRGSRGAPGRRPDPRPVACSSTPPRTGCTSPTARPAMPRVRVLRRQASRGRCASGDLGSWPDRARPHPFGRARTSHRHGPQGFCRARADVDGGAVAEPYRP